MSNGIQSWLTKPNASSDRHLLIDIAYRNIIKSPAILVSLKSWALMVITDRADPEILAQRPKLFRNPNASTTLDPLNEP